MIKRFLSLSVLIAMLWGCCSVEDTPIGEKTAVYKVEHYQQNANDDGYTLVEADSENKNGTTGKETSALAKTYEGFTAKTVDQVKITADGSAVVKIYYDRNEITLTLDLAGGEGQTEITGKYGAAVSVTAPTKTGYDFVSWNPELPTTFPAENATYKATWTVGNGTAYKVEHYQQNITDDEYTLADTENKTGTTDEETSAQAKTYDGFTAKTVEQVKITADGKAVVKIYYDRNEITLTLDLDGGEGENEIIGKYGVTVNIAAPTRDGYEFACWNPQLPETFPATNATYTATWAKEGDYVITYNLNGGTNASDNPASYNVETATIKLKNATKTGYTFGGWYTDEACTEAKTQIEKGSTGNLTLYAKWNANTNTAYKVEHYQQNIDNDEYALAEADTENKTGTTDTDTVATAKDYAGFTAKTIEQMKIAADGSTVVKIYYDRKKITLTLNLDGGEGTESITGKYGADVTVPANPAKDGYEFVEWNPELPAILPAENATYTAQWKTVTYTITYNLNGGTNASSNPTSYTVETDTITLANATKKGYTFLGWYDENGDKVTHVPSGTTKSISVTAKWWDSTGFARVQGATINGAITANGYTTSNIFKAGNTVTVGNFYICDHEVTQAEYETYCSYGGSEPSEAKGDGNNYPAYYVSWYDALVYCNKRSIAEGLTPCYTINGSTNPTDWGDVPTSSDSSNIDKWKAATCDFTANGYRLPTEAEWEYAARGGNGLAGYQYEYAGSDTIGDVAWYGINSSDKTHAVKYKQANRLGLYDMSGNVWEWCWDAYSGGSRYRRGGGWSSPAGDCSVSSRGSYSAYNRNFNIGFRVVRTAD